MSDSSSGFSIGTVGFWLLLAWGWFGDDDDDDTVDANVESSKAVQSKITIEEVVNLKPATSIQKDTWIDDTYTVHAIEDSTEEDWEEFGFDEQERLDGGESLKWGDD